MSTLAPRLRRALRYITGGQAEAAVVAVLDEGGTVPAYDLATILAGIPRTAVAWALALGALAYTADGTAVVAHRDIEPEKISAVVADHHRQREERRAARAAARAAAADTSPAALEARAAAERERKARNKAAQRARERGAQAPASSSPPAASPAPPVTAPLSPPPVTASQPVTSPVTPPPPSPPPAGDTPPPVTAPVTASPACEGTGASDPPSPPHFKIPGKGEGESPREVAAPVTAPEAPRVVSEVLPAGSLEAQLLEVVLFWAAAFQVEPTTASESSKAAVAFRLREPHATVAHVLAAVRRAARPGSWFWKGDPDRRQLANICGEKFADLRDEGLGLVGPTSGRSPSPPPASSPPATAPALASTSRPGWPAEQARPPRQMPGDAFPGADREQMLPWSGRLWLYENGSWHNMGLDPNAQRRGTG